MERFAVAFQDRGANVGVFQSQVSARGGQVGADGQAHEVVGIGHRPGLVEVVDPRSGGLRNRARCRNSPRAGRRPPEREGLWRDRRRPPPARAAPSGSKVARRKGKISAFMLACLRCRSFLTTVVRFAASLKLAGGLDHVHAGKDSGGVTGSQMPASNSFTTEAQKHGEHRKRQEK